MIDYFDEINKAKYLYLENIDEPRDSSIVVTIAEAEVSAQGEDIFIGDKNLGPVSTITNNGTNRKYQIGFESYVAYNVINESFTSYNDQEEWVGNLFRVYSKSNYLNYINTDTFAEAYYQADESGSKLKHFCIVCLNHIVHVVSIKEPVIIKIEPTHIS